MLKEQFANIKKIMLYSDYSLIGKVKDLEDEIDHMRSTLIMVILNVWKKVSVSLKVVVFLLI